MKNSTEKEPIKSFTHYPSNKSSSKELSLPTESPISCFELTRHNNRMNEQLRRLKDRSNFLSTKKKLIKQIYNLHMDKVEKGRILNRAWEGKKKSRVRQQREIYGTDIVKPSVYISNIVNLEQVKSSLSLSKSCFDKQKIIFNREVGKKYVPFSDQVSARVALSSNKINFSLR